MEWLLRGDVSIQYQVRRDLFGEHVPKLQAKIASAGWGAAFLAKRQNHGHWGQKFYQPKWISSHYTLLDLKHLQILPQPAIMDTIRLILTNERAKNGCINPAGSGMVGDVCINGMFLNYAAYFGIRESELEPIVDFILGTRLPDGGFNCNINRQGAHHSSMHTTISVLEGLLEFQARGYRYRYKEIIQARRSSEEFLLMHELYKSDHSGQIIHPAFLRLPFPSRWKYDILRALVYFQSAQCPWDNRLKPALDVLIKKRNSDGSWNLNAPYAGQVHFHMEQAGQPSRWNTLRALKVIMNYEL